MDVDEHIDLVDTLGDMLGQKAESKKDKFIDTMPTIIQTHLITEKNWPVTTKKSKELEHIIRKCDPPVAALAKGTTVPSLYSHIAHSNDKGLIPSNPSLKVEAKVSSLNKNRKTHHHKHTRIHIIMRILAIITIMRIIGASPEVADLIEDKIQNVPLEVKIFMVEVTKIRTYTKTNIKMTVIKAIITRVIEDSIIINLEISLKAIVVVNQGAEAMAMVEVITTVVVTVDPIIEAMLITNIISIMLMMMNTRQINMVHHVLYAVDIITLPNIVLKESMISMTLWKR